MFKKKSIWLPERCPHGKRNSSANVKSIFRREKANHCGAKHLHHGPQSVFAVPTTQTGMLSRDLWVFPVLVSWGLRLCSKHAQSWFIAFLCYFFLTLKLQRLLKYNKMHGRATRMTNSTYRCTHNRCTLVKAPSQSADISPVKWRVPSCELDAFCSSNMADRLQSGPPRSYLPVFMPLNTVVFASDLHPFYRGETSSYRPCCVTVFTGFHSFSYG